MMTTIRFLSDVFRWAGAVPKPYLPAGAPGPSRRRREQ
jgi:hypothetical protein